ncbi:MULTISPECIES: hypothetical protein [Cupriavidus]
MQLMQWLAVSIVSFGCFATSVHAAEPKVYKADGVLGTTVDLLPNQCKLGPFYEWQEARLNLPPGASMEGCWVRGLNLDFYLVLVPSGYLEKIQFIVLAREQLPDYSEMLKNAQWPAQRVIKRVSDAEIHGPFFVAPESRRR